MSWGTYWFYYECPNCREKFSWDLCTISSPTFGCCPKCGAAGDLKGESANLPAHPEEYPDCSE